MSEYEQKTKDWATRPPLKHCDELRCCGRINLSAPLVAPIVLLLLKIR